MRQREVEGDQRPHGMAHHVGPLDAEPVEKGQHGIGIVGEQRRIGGPG